MSRRLGKVFVGSVGWVTKKDTESRDYSEYANAWWAFLIWTFRWFPDKLLDLFRSEGASFKTLEIVQRVMLRAYARNADCALTGTRGMTKTYCKLLSSMAEGIVWPNTKMLYTSPSYKQGAAIGSKTFRAIEGDYKLLTSHWRVTAESKDDFKIETDMGSSFYIASMRGDNIHEVTAEEFAQEEAPAFDFGDYTTIVLPAVRLRHNVNGEPDPNYVAYKSHSITSAGRKQNQAFLIRCEVMRAMHNGESAFAMDIPWEAVILQQMRPYSWAMKLKKKLTPERWMREMESRYTGADEFPIITDETLTESQSLMCMERQHICKYPDMKDVNPEDVTYIVCYDVSYEDGKKNARCACGVWKLTKQSEFVKRDRYLKQLVWMDDWPPPDNAMIQARKVKDVWNRFRHDGGNATYIVIDGWQYGKAVIENLMMDLGDGLPPLCILNHEEYTEAELPGAIPVIYPIKAGGVGVTDPDAEMIRYAQIQFDNHNIQLLTMNAREGVDAYKRLHRIKHDQMDYRIVMPYQQTRKLCGQIQNLRGVPASSGIKEQRISKAIQRDSWSAIKYGLRLCQILEKEDYLQSKKPKGDWGEILARYKDQPVIGGEAAGGRKRVVTKRSGGRIF